VGFFKQVGWGKTSNLAKKNLKSQIIILYSFELIMIRDKFDCEE
jgi:hypothetical protein